MAVVSGSSFAPDGTDIRVSPADLVNGRMPMNIGGVCVLVNSAPAPMLALTPNQISFPVPQTPVPGTLFVQVATGCGTEAEMRSNTETVAVQSASPEFFYFVRAAAGQNPIVARAEAGALVGTPGLLPDATFAPAKPGDVITLYATGLGVTSPSFAAGELPSQPSPLAGDVSVWVGFARLAPADVLYAGASLTEPGVYEVKIRVPASVADGLQPVRISVNGFASPSGGYIAVQR